MHHWLKEGTDGRGRHTLHQSSWKEHGWSENRCEKVERKNTYICKTKGIICSTWQQIKQEAVERHNVSLKPGRPVAKWQETRKSLTSIEFSSSGKHLKINYRQFHRGWGHSGIQRLWGIAQMDGESGPEQGVPTRTALYTRDHFPLLGRKCKKSSKTSRQK